MEAKQKNQRGLNYVIIVREDAGGCIAPPAIF